MLADWYFQWGATHSMNQRPSISGDEISDTVIVASFANGMIGMFDSIIRLSEWSKEIVRRNCASTGLSQGQPIPIATYLEAVAPLSRQVAFDAMCVWWRAQSHAHEKV